MSHAGARWCARPTSGWTENSGLQHLLLGCAAASVLIAGSLPTCAEAEAQCPCFTREELEAVVSRDEGRYRFSRFEGEDPAGDACRAARLNGGEQFDFLAAVKRGAAQPTCPVRQFYPVISLVPNGCYKRLGRNISELALNIEPQDALVCYLLLEKYAQ